MTSRECHEPMDLRPDESWAPEMGVVTGRMHYAILVAPGEFAHDAEGFRLALLIGAGFSQENICVLIGEAATGDNIVSAFKEVEASAKANPLQRVELIFYFSGHSGEFPAAILADATHSASHQVSQILIIKDCCHAEAMDLTLQRERCHARQHHGRIIQWSACSSEQTATGFTHRLSRFTGYLVAAFMGGKSNECPFGSACEGCRRLAYNASFDHTISTYDVEAYIAYHCSRDDGSGQPMQTPVFTGRDTGPSTIALFRPAT